MPPRTLSLRSGSSISSTGGVQEPIVKIPTDMITGIQWWRVAFLLVAVGIAYIIFGDETTGNIIGPRNAMRAAVTMRTPCAILTTI